MQPSYAEAKKMKSLTFHTLGWLAYGTVVVVLLSVYALDEYPRASHLYLFTASMIR